MAPGRQADRRVRRRRPLRVHQCLLPALRHARRGRRARRARGGPPALSRGLRVVECAGRRDRRRRDGRAPRGQRAQRARRGSTTLRRVHRGPPAQSPQGCAHGSGAGHLPGRVGARRRLGRAHGDLPLRRRSGDDGPSARRRVQVPERVPRIAGRAAGTQRPHSRLHRGVTADREPGEGGLPPGPAQHDGGRGGSSRPGPRSWC